MGWRRMMLSTCSLASAAVAGSWILSNRDVHLSPKTLAASVQALPVDDVAVGGPSSLWDDNWDRRDPSTMVAKKIKSSEEEAERPTAVRKLFLVRHGQYNLTGATDDNKSLTDLGRMQAELTAQRLLQLGLQPTVIYYSTMTRARETFEAVAKVFPNVPTRSSDLLREGSPCPPEPPSKTWRPEAKQFHTDGARIEAAFRKHFHRADAHQKEDSIEILVCHGNVIRYFVCRALQLPPEAWLRISLAHCSITQVNIRPSGHVSVYGLGDVGHMPADMITR